MKLFGRQLEATVDDIISDSGEGDTVKSVLSRLFGYCREHGIQCDQGEARRVVQSKMGLREQFDKLVERALNG